MASAPSATHLRLINFAGAFLLQLKNSHEVRWSLHNKHAKCGPDFIPRWKSTGGSLRRAHWDKWVSWVTMYKVKVKSAQLRCQSDGQWAVSSEQGLFFLPTHSPPTTTTATTTKPPKVSPSAWSIPQYHDGLFPTGCQALPARAFILFTMVFPASLSTPGILSACDEQDRLLFKQHFFRNISTWQ